MIYFVRHGETDFNKEGRNQGWLDVPLNETGIAQAKILADKLKDFKIDVIYCSPFSRTKKTAEIINEFHNVSIITDDRLKEYYSSEREGKVFNKLPKFYRDDCSINPDKYGAEGLLHFYYRNIEAYKDIVALNKNVLMVGHSAFYVMYERFQDNNLDFSNKKYKCTVENCGIRILKK